MTRHEYLADPYPHAKRGTDLPHARLTPEAVRAIRANVSGEPRHVWAKRFGVHLRTVDKVATFETWRHV